MKNIILESLSLDLIANTAKNLVSELSRYDNINSHRTLQSVEVIKWFDELLFFSKNIEKITFFKNKEDDKEWDFEIIYRFKTIESSFVKYPVMEETIFPFAPHWTREFEHQTNIVWEMFEEHGNERRFFDGLVEIGLMYAKSIIGESNKKLSIVCGPISTGPGTVKQKLTRFQKAIHLLPKNVNSEILVFDQMSFETVMHKYHVFLKGEESSGKILKYFYEPIFESNLVQDFHFLTGWEHSKGASRERQIATNSKFMIRDLPEDFTDDFWIKFFEQKTKQ